MTRFAEALAADGLKAMKRMSGKVIIRSEKFLSTCSSERPRRRQLKKYLVRKRVSQFSTMGKTIGNIKTSSTSPSAGAEENNFSE